MKRFLLLAITLAPLFSFSQNIKIKKGDILLNKTEKIGTSDSSYDSALATLRYAISDLKGNTVNVHRVMGDSGSTSDYYYILSSSFNDSKWELSASDIGSSVAKGTIKYLIREGFWNPKEGINISALNEKINNTGTAISTAKNETKLNEERVKAINPFVRRSGEIVKGGYEGTEIIGYVESPDHHVQTLVSPIKIYDINKNLIAKASSKLNNETAITFDGVEHKYKVKKELNEITKPLFLSELVYLLMLEGYIYDGEKNYDASLDTFQKD